MENNQVNEDEIDLIELLRKIWDSKNIIIKTTILFFVLGVLMALFSAKEYTSSTVMIPQTASGSNHGGALSGLAAMAGINLGGGSTETIPPTLYPKVVESVPFRQKMLETPISMDGFDKDITYAEYYSEHIKPSVFDYVIKYTIGLPGLIFGGKNDDEKSIKITDTDSTIVTISRKEFDLLNAVKSQIDINVNEKEGYVTLSYVMPEALPAAQMLQNAQQLLQNTITEFKIKKATEELDFIEQRYQEVEKEFKAKQFALAQFQDQNRNLFSNLPQTRLQQLQTEYNLAYGVYSELAKQLESQKIKVKEETPVFTIIEPVTVPIERSKPKRAMIVAIWTFLGIVAGVAYIFGTDFAKQFTASKQNNEEE